MNDAPPTLTLFADTFWISPYVFSCYVTLREKGLDFSVDPVALESKEQEAPAYRDRPLTGRVPALRHGDFWLAESQAIVESLDDAFPDTPRAVPLPNQVAIIHQSGRIFIFFISFSCLTSYIIIFSIFSGIINAGIVYKLKDIIFIRKIYRNIKK